MSTDAPGPSAAARPPRRKHPPRPTSRTDPPERSAPAPPPLQALVDLEEARSIDAIVDAFRARLAERDPADRSPLIGAKYDPALLAEHRHPTRDDLDAVSTQIPVFALHRSMHVAVGNSFLVDGAGLMANAPDPEGGCFGRRADGTPDGYGEEHPAMAACLPILDPFGTR